MRSLNLASNLKERGVDISFITTELPDFFSRLLRDKQIEHYQLTTKNLSQETEEVLKFLKKFKTKPNWAVVDHYQLDECWERAVRPWVEQIAVIDDLANRRHDCDLLIDPNLRTNGEKVYRPLVPTSCKLLLGPRFALLSSNFAKKRKQIFQRKGEVREMLVSFGGSDPANAVGRTVNALAVASNRFDGILNVVTGKLNPNLRQIEKKITSIKNAELHIQTDQMAELMAKSDLAIGAGGTELWERCCLGLPSIVMATNPNQVGQLEALAKIGAIFYLGQSTKISEEKISKAFEMLSGNSYWLSHSSAAAMNLVDGKGAYRVASWMLKKNLNVRRALPKDKESIYTWRNANETRKYSFNDQPISENDHELWFKETLASDNRVLLIVEDASGAVGVLRYDLAKLEATVSIYLVPTRYGFGYGPVVLAVGNEWLQKEFPQIEMIKGEILSQNKPSESAFLEAGFDRHHTEFTKPLKMKKLKEYVHV